MGWAGQFNVIMNVRHPAQCLECRNCSIRRLLFPLSRLPIAVVVTNLGSLLAGGSALAMVCKSWGFAPKGSVDRQSGSKLPNSVAISHLGLLSTSSVTSGNEKLNS